MEKKVYELKINETLERVMPPLQELELKLLTESLLKEGCRDKLVVWNGTIIDGHNRYRICREHNIPFSYKEEEFDDEAAAKMWIISNQIGRRNLSAFVKCELVLPMEAELKAEAKKRQGQRNDLKNIVPSLTRSEKPKNSRETLSNLAQVSHGTFDKAKQLINGADEETKTKLRNGEITINKAYQELMDRQKKAETPVIKKESSTESFTDSEHHLLGSGPLPGQLPEGATYRMPDSVYDIPPIEVYGNMPSDDMKLRGNAEMIHAKSDLQGYTDNYLRRISDVLRGMSMASTNEENIQTLRGIVTDAYNQIIDMFDRKLGGQEDEENE